MSLLPDECRGIEVGLVICLAAMLTIVFYNTATWIYRWWRGRPRRRDGR